MNKIVLFLLAFLLIAGGVSVNAYGRLLTGSIEHSENLAPVEADLRPGAQFSPDEISKSLCIKRNHWYRIPAWFAGTWHQDFSTVIRSFQYETNVTDSNAHQKRDKIDRKYGDQIDENGNVWSFDNCPFTVLGEFEGKKMYGIFKTFEPVASDRNSITFRAIQMHVTVDPVTERILVTSVNEALSSFTRTGENTCHSYASVKVFDMSGKPTHIYETVSEREKIAPFQATQEVNGEELAPLFQQFRKQAD
jgi:hypothetical protein